jgi:glycosyltransferase involved in cell wall biosynthesis
VSTPTISALVCAYNAEEHITDTLEAILGQTRPPDEVVVIDDGSTDGTPAALARFGRNIRVVRQANGGHAAAINRGIAETRGTYIARCDADDVWTSERLERQASSLGRHATIDIAFGGALSFGLHEQRWRNPPGEGVLDERAFARAMYSWNFICSSTVLIRRRLCDALGPFLTAHIPAEDYDYWLRALRAHAVFYYDPALLVRYRVHDGNLTNDALRMRRATHRVHEAHTDVAPSRILVRSVLARDRADIGRELVSAGDLATARSSYFASLRLLPAPRPMLWALLLSVPTRLRELLVGHAISLKRVLAVRTQAAGGEA